MNSILKTLISIVVILILLWAAWALLKFTIHVLLPIAVIVIAAYIVYMFVAKRR